MVITRNVLIHSTDPTSGETIGSVANCNLEDFKNAIDDAYEAQTQFAENTTAAERGSMLQKWNNVILANKQDC